MKAKDSRYTNSIHLDSINNKVVGDNSCRKYEQFELIYLVNYIQRCVIYAEMYIHVLVWITVATFGLWEELHLYRLGIYSNIS